MTPGKDAALDAAHSLKTDTDCKLYGMGVKSPINAMLARDIKPFKAVALVLTVI